MLGNDDADVSNQKSRNYKEENIISHLKRFSSLVALMPTLRAGFSLLMYKETPRNKAESSCCFVYDSECFLKWLNSRDTKSQWKKIPNFVVRKIKMSDNEYSLTK